MGRLKADRPGEVTFSDERIKAFSDDAVEELRKMLERELSRIYAGAYARWPIGPDKPGWKGGLSKASLRYAVTADRQSGIVRGQIRDDAMRRGDSKTYVAFARFKHYGPHIWTTLVRTPVFRAKKRILEEMAQLCAQSAARALDGGGK